MKLAKFSMVRAALVREEAPPYAPTGPLRSPEESGKWLLSVMPDDGKEHFWVLGLSVRHHLILAEEVSTGCLTSSLVHPREVFIPLILGKCAATIVAHNHPSGDCEPSAEDLALTRRLAAAGLLLGIELLDHVIVGSGAGRFVSMKQRGVM